MIVTHYTSLFANQGIFLQIVTFKVNPFWNTANMKPTCGSFVVLFELNLK